MFITAIGLEFPTLIVFPFRTRDNHGRQMTDGEGVDYGNPLVIVDGNEKWVGEVLCEAACWWESFLTEWHVAEAPPFIPTGDRDGPVFPIEIPAVSNSTVRWIVGAADFQMLPKEEQEKNSN